MNIGAMASGRDKAADISATDHNIRNHNTGKLKGPSLDLVESLSYTTGKTLRVNVWQLGLFFKLSQVGLLFYVVCVSTRASHASARAQPKVIWLQRRHGCSAAHIAYMPACVGHRRAF